MTNTPPTPPPWHRLRFPVVVALFLSAYAAFIILLSWLFLIPAYAAARDAAPEQREWVAAISALLLAVVLAILVVGLFLVFRIRRFFFPRPGKAGPTQYEDALENGPNPPAG